jgi:phosphodiesterase/alkaline phosphatase D-like protein
MTKADSEFDLELSRRRLLTAAGIAGGVAVAASLVGGEVAQAAEPAAAGAPASSAIGADPLTTPPVAGLHLQFGGDASSEMVASWHTLQPVKNARIMLGTLKGQLDRVVAATESRYTDAKSGQVIYAYHAKLNQLKPNAEYLYGALHDGAEAAFATFRTAPRGRAKFTFTSFGDQATPTVGRNTSRPKG